MATNPTLPGVRVTLSDSYYSANDTNPDAARVLIIATPNVGSSVALYNPVLYGSEQAVLAACGAGSDAHVAFVQAIRSGANNVYVACVDPAKTTVADREAELVSALEYADMVEPDIIVTYGFYANDVVPGTPGPDIVKNITAIAGAEGDLMVTLTATGHGFVEGDVLTIAGLTPARLNGEKTVEEVVASNKFIISTGTAALDAAEATALAVTDASATKEVITGTRLVNNAKNLGLKCHQLMRDLNPCVGVIALKPIAQDEPTATEVGTYVTAITGAKVEVPSNETQLPVANVVDLVKAVVPTDETAAVDLGRYLSVCVGKVIVRGQPASIAEPYVPVFTSCEAVVAGQIYRTPLESAITSAPLLNVVDISNNFSRSQKIALVGARVNPVCLSSASTIITLDGWTLASPDATTAANSVYERLSTVRIVNEVIKATRNELEKFIGMQASTARLNSIETKLRTIYTSFKAAGVLRNAEFKIVYSQGSGVLTVDLSLVPFGEMRTVDVTVSVKINA